jgi:hypothetical protein
MVWYSGASGFGDIGRRSTTLPAFLSAVRCDRIFVRYCFEYPLGAPTFAGRSSFSISVVTHCACNMH